MINFKCSHCGQEIEAEDEWCGNEANCPLCNRTLTVPPKESISELPFIPLKHHPASVEQYPEPAEQSIKISVPTDETDPFDGSDGTIWRYAAFISYRHAETDRKWAKWLHEALETYRIPKTLAQELGIPHRIGRCFRDEDELPASADLNNEIETALKYSKFLIVICSPRTPSSEWVNKEVLRFREMGRGNRILALLVEGEPTESFPRALQEIRHTVIDSAGNLKETVEAVEPLAADVRTTRPEPQRKLKRLARLRLIACTLGCRFDDLIERDNIRDRRKKLRLTFFSVFALISLLILMLFIFNAKVSENKARIEAEKATVMARNEADISAKTAEVSRRSRYFSQIRQAEDEYRNGNIMGTIKILETSPEDLRNWEWNRLYNLRTADDQKPMLLKFARRFTRIDSAAVSPDGKWLAFNGEHWLTLWNILAGTYGASFDRAMTPAVFSPDGKRIAATTYKTMSGYGAWGKGTVKIWDAQTGAELITPEEQSHVNALSFSPDGKLLVVAADNRLNAYESKTGKAIWKTDCNSKDIRVIYFTPDSAKIIAAFCNGDFNLIDAATGSLERSAISGLKQLSSAAISPDGKVLVATGRDDFTINSAGKAILWDISSWPWKITKTLSAFGTDEFSAVAWNSKSPRWIATGGRYTGGREEKSSNVILWDVVTGRNINFMGLDSMGGITWIGFTSDELLVAATENDIGIWACDRSGKAKDLTLSGHGTVPCQMRFSPDGRRVVSRESSFGRGFLWDVASGKLLLAFDWDNAPSNYNDSQLNAFSPDGKLFIFCSANGSAVICNAETGAKLITLQSSCLSQSRPLTPAPVPGGPFQLKRTEVKGISCVGFSPDSRNVIASSARGDTACIWDAATGELKLELAGKEAGIPYASFNNDGTLAITIALGSEPDTARFPGHSYTMARIWDAITGKLLMEGTLINLLHINTRSKNGDIICSSTDILNKLKKTDVPLTEQLSALTKLNTCEFLPKDVSHLSDPTKSYIVFQEKIHDLKTGNTIATLESPRKPMIFSPNGRWFAFCSSGNTVKLWDSKSGTEPLTLHGHADTVTALHFSPDSRRLVTGSSDKTARLWDVETGSEAMVLRGHNGGIASVMFSPDGRYILSAGEDKIIRIWDSGGLTGSTDDLR